MAKHEVGTMRKLIVSNAMSLDGYYVLPRRDRQMCVTQAERPMGGAFPPADRQPRDAAAGAVTPLPSSA